MIKSMMDDSKRVVVTGLGVVSSLGIGWEEFWKNLMAGKSGISRTGAGPTLTDRTFDIGEFRQVAPDRVAEASAYLQSQGARVFVSSVHLHYLNPFPKNLGDVLSRFETVLVPELNLGQLALLVRAKYLVDVISFSKVKGKPFKVSELVDKIKEHL